MTRPELEHFHERLTALAERLRDDRDAVRGEALRAAGGEASGSLSNAPRHLADLGSDTAQQEVSVGLLENTQYTLREVAEALQRIDSGEYGRCRECGRDIPRPRLEALPHTTLCVDCASRLEQEGAKPPPTPSA